MEKINYLIIKNIDLAILDPVIMMIEEKYFAYDFESRRFMYNPALNKQIKKLLTLYKIVDKQEALDAITILEAKNLLLGAKSDT